MKFSKLILLSALVLIALLPVFADGEAEQPIQQQSEEIQLPLVTEPKWEEFCEIGYENAKKTDREDVFDVFSFVKAERVKKNYWPARGESFEKYLSTCNAMTNEMSKAECYTELRRIEKSKNDDYSHQRKELLYQRNIIIDK